MNSPLVTIICLCYNHARFVEEAIQSVWHQTYQNIELIIVDDASTDNSVEVIQKLIQDKPQISFIANTENLGSCRSFNKALKLAKGNYFIDLAADDVLLPDRVQKGVALLREKGSEYGVQFSDAEIIDEEGKHLRYHSTIFPHSSIPQGDVYPFVINRYFICSPTMMFTRAVMELLNGYDEALAFEDFDLWVRASRKYKFCYLPEVLIKRRMVSTSMSKAQFKGKNAQRWSTYLVCKKIKNLNQTKEEEKALRQRLRYEILLSLKMLDFGLALHFFKLMM